MKYFIYQKMFTILLMYICAWLTCCDGALSATNFVNGTIRSNSEVSVARNIRCYCNLPGCIQKGYMCKSQEGVCFSKYELKHRSEIPDRGCLELLTENQKTICRRKADLLESSTNESQSDPPIFDCCRQNVCNFGTTLSRGPTVQPKQDPINPISTGQFGWAKILTLSIPLGGSVVFIGMVICAAKMLSQESKLKETCNSVSSYYCPSIQYKPPSSQPESRLSFSKGIVNPGMSSSTIYSKDFADSLHETQPLTCQFQGNTI